MESFFGVYGLKELVRFGFLRSEEVVFGFSFFILFVLGGTERFFCMGEGVVIKLVSRL